MISRWRGRSLPSRSTDQTSSASGSSVWHVYAKHCWVTAQASSQSHLFSSTRIRMSSGIAMTGWVSLSWKMIRSGRLCRSKSGGSTSSMKFADRARDEEVLLLQAQLLALRRGVLGVEHLGDVLRERLRPHRLGVVAGVEDLQVERARRLGAPQAQRVDAAVLVARDHVVVRDAQHAPARHPPASA